MADQQTPTPETAQEKQNKMGYAPMGRLLISMAVPVMLSMLVQALYNVVDSIFVAQVGQDALTTLSLAFPIQMLITAVSMGTSVGVNSLIARRLGAREVDEANSAVRHGLLLSVMNGVIFALLGILFTTAFFGAYTDNPAIIAMGRQYITTITFCSVFVFVEVMIERSLQATGNMTYPMMFQMTGAIINIILDPIFIFGLLGVPAMGVFGAALATVTGQFCAMVFALFIFLTKKFEIKVSYKNFRWNSAIVKEIYRVGIPTMLMQSLTSVLVVCVNSILMTLSDAAVAILGIYYKLQNFIFMPVFGLSMGALPIVGYNFGAKNKNRIMECLKKTIGIATCIMVMGTAVFWVIPEPLLHLFNASDAMMEIGVSALRILSIAFIPAAAGISLSTFFQGLGHGTKSLYHSLVRQLIVTLPLAWLFARTGNLNAVWATFPLAEVIADLFALYLLWLVYKNTIKNFGEPANTQQ